MTENTPAGRDWSGDQAAALERIRDWHRAGGSKLTLGGLAGTGKTTLAAALEDELGARIAYCAPTGRAALVLRRKGMDARTIHQLLYVPSETAVCRASGQVIPDPGDDARCPAHPRTGEHAHPLHRCGQCRGGCPAKVTVSYQRKDSAALAEEHDLILADEASMITAEIWDDIREPGLPVLAVGDHGQLPPVKSGFSLMRTPDILLEEIRRQSAGSPVIALAMMAREGRRLPFGEWDCGRAGTARRVPRAQADPHQMRPEDGDLIICATNAERVRLNAEMRGHAGPPAAGDIIVCLKNDYLLGMINGARGVLLSAGEPYCHRCYGGGHERCLQVMDAEAMTEASPGKAWSGVALASQFGQREKHDGRLPKGIALLDWGYAITAHKAQGSEASRVMVIEEGWPRYGTEERRRWLYTAITRARHDLIIAGGR